MTGVPIYLVSACTSGEEFVAAFRRYADKNGLFIPISEPLPPGGRSRFALTLRDGGVMIEGEAQIVSAARTPSVVHGRVGMTLRFVETDDASRTTLGELEKARLAMRPQPPSVPPRPAEIPAEPRPVPPPVQGRIDAVNALAECVVIGDTTVLGLPLPAVTTPPKAGPRFVSPTSPDRSAPGTSPPGGLGVASRAAAPRASTAPMSMVMTRSADPAAQGDRESAPPSITPRATPQPDRLRSTGRTEPGRAISGLSQTMTAAPIAPGSSSDTMVAAMPPAPPSETSSSSKGPISTTMTAVPVSSALPPSAPTEIGAIVVPTDTDDDASARTQVHAGAPTPPPAPLLDPREAAPPSGAEHARSDARAHRVSDELSQTLRGMGPDDIDVRVTAAVAVPATPSAAMDVGISEAITGLAISPLSDSPVPRTLGDLEVDLAEATDISMPPEPPITQPPEAPLEMMPESRPDIPLDLALEEPTDPPREATEAAPEAAPEVAPEVAIDRPLAAPPPNAAISHPMTGEAGPDPASRPRKTVIGVAVTPSGVMVLPATPTLPMQAARGAGAEVASEAAQSRPVVGDSTVDVDAPTVPPTSGLGSAAAALDEQTPEEVWPLPASEPAPARPAPPHAAASATALPSGDWTIARDPEAPDGWSEPVGAPGSPRLRDDLPTPPPFELAAGAAAPDAVPAFAHAAPASAAPVAATPPPLPRPSEVPIVEPKVQIDPTLIEPAHAADDSHVGMVSSPEIAMYGGDSRPAIEAPAIQMMMAVPQPGMFTPPPGQQMLGGQLPYAMDPGYPGMPVPMRPSPPYLAGGAGFIDPRYASNPALPVQARRLRLVIVLVSALVAVMLGIAAILLLGQRDAAPADRNKAGAAGASGALEPSAPPVAAAAPSPAAPAPTPPTGAEVAPTPATPPAPPAPAPGSPPAAEPERGAAPAEPATRAEVTAPAPASECFADVRSQPQGADIVVAQTVIGTTPQRVALPCGQPVELVLRKQRLAQAARTVTPTPEGTLVKVALTRQTVPVKVSSTPPGATVTLNGKSLGVTPTMIKLPAFEISTLLIAKDGYETEPEKVAPRNSGAAVHTVLKKIERKKPR